MELKRKKLYWYMEQKVWSKKYNVLDPMSTVNCQYLQKKMIGVLEEICS